MVEEDNNPTASGESLDEVLSTIRETVNAYVEKGEGMGDDSSPLALALRELRGEIGRLQNKLALSADSPLLTPEHLEKLITQLARPMLELILQSWVDKNLPALAEQVIREEIEKISREIRR